MVFRQEKKELMSFGMRFNLNMSPSRDRNSTWDFGLAAQITPFYSVYESKLNTPSNLFEVIDKKGAQKFFFGFLPFLIA